MNPKLCLWRKMSGTSKFDLTDHNERERKGTAAVMSSRKTEMRVRVSLSLKGQGGRGSRRHGKMLQILTKKHVSSFNLWNEYHYLLRKKLFTLPLLHSSNMSITARKIKYSPGTYLPTYLPTDRLTHPPTYLPTYLQCKS